MKENHETDKPCLLRLGRVRWKLGIRAKLGTREVGKSLDFIIFLHLKIFLCMSDLFAFINF